MLRTELPQIVTDTLPGPKALAMIERRKAATPSAIRCVYPLVIQRGEGAMVERKQIPRLGWRRRSVEYRLLSS